MKNRFTIVISVAFKKTILSKKEPPDEKIGRLHY